MSDNRFDVIESVLSESQNVDMTDPFARGRVAHALVDALGLTTEFAVCITAEDGTVQPMSRRYLAPEGAARDAGRLPDRFGAFVATAEVTKWERVNG